MSLFVPLLEFRSSCRLNIQFQLDICLPLSHVRTEYRCISNSIFNFSSIFNAIVCTIFLNFDLRTGSKLKVRSIFALDWVTLKPNIDFRSSSVFYFSSIFKVSSIFVLDSVTLEPNIDFRCSSIFNFSSNFTVMICTSFLNLDVRAGLKFKVSSIFA